MNIAGYNYFKNVDFDYIGGNIKLTNTLIYDNSTGFDLHNLAVNTAVSLTFNNANAKFINNKSTVFSAKADADQKAASVAFNNSVISFQNNENINNDDTYADIKGAIDTNNVLSGLSFNNSTVYFTNNNVVSSLGIARGGAISIGQASTVSFVNSRVYFTKNSANAAANPAAGGGAIYLEDSFDASVYYVPTLIVRNSQLVFDRNETSGYGGGFFSGNLNVSNHPSDNNQPWANFINSYLSFSQNKAAVGGAFVVGDMSKVYVDNTPILFSHNISTNGGAAAVVAQRVGQSGGYKTILTISNSPVTFDSNTAQENGGALYVYTSAASASPMTLSTIETNFIGGETKFSNNVAKSSGGAIYMYGGQNINRTSVVFSGGNKSNFSNNSALLAGGAISVYTRSSLIFAAQTSFVENTAPKGGALYVEYSIPDGTKGVSDGNGDEPSIFFNNADTVFSGNTADEGAVAYIKGAKEVPVDATGKTLSKYAGIHFNGGNVTFINNRSTGTDSKGIISFDYDTSGNSYSTITFSNNVNVTAINNEATQGGFLYLTWDNISEAGLIFDGTVNISGNRAAQGAALYLSAEVVGSYTVNIGTVTFTGNTTISNNIMTAGDNTDLVNGGGAIYFESNDDPYAKNLSVDFSQVKSLRAYGNTNTASGGFTFLYKRTMEFNGNVAISYNESRRAGGAIYMGDNSTLDLNTVGNRGDIYFVDNVAASSGGAIYATDSTLNLNAQTGNIVFTGNTDTTGRPNDVYLDAGASIDVKTGAGNIYFASGISGVAGTQITAQESGTGRTVIGGNVYLAGEIAVNGTGKIYLSGNSGAKGDYAGKAMYVSSVSVSLQTTPGGTFGVGDPNSGSKSKLLIDGMQIGKGGTLEIVINAGSRGYGQVVVSSYIYVDNTDTSSKLRLNVKGNGWTKGKAIVRAGDENATKADEWYLGAFSDFDYAAIDEYTKVLSISQDKTNKYTGEFEVLRHQDFNDLPTLSQNQKEIGKSISASKWTTNTDATDFVKALRVYIGDKGDEKGKEALDSLSGVFLVNALKMGAVQDNASSLYSRMDVMMRTNKVFRTREDIIYDSIWLLPTFKNVHYKEDDSNPRSFNANAYGAKAGVNIIVTEKVLGGFFLDLDINNLKQGDDTASMTKVGAGGFLGIYGQKIDVKINLAAAQQSFSTKRKFLLQSNTEGNYYVREAIADFHSYSINLGGEVAYIVGISNEVEMRPFVGLQNTAVFNDEINERMGDIINLKVESDQFLRSDFTAGIKIADATGGKGLKWYGKIYAGYILVGNSNDYEISFQTESMNGGARRNIRSYDEKRLFGGLGAGAEWSVKTDVSLYTNIDALVGDNSYGYFANIGVNFRYGGNSKVRENKF
jgi:predicted outer membrane repeat protein